MKRRPESPEAAAQQLRQVSAANYWEIPRPMYGAKGHIPDGPSDRQ